MTIEEVTLECVECGDNFSTDDANETVCDVCFKISCKPVRPDHSESFMGGS